MTRHALTREAVFVENVTTPAHRARGLDDAAVARLVESMARLGLRTPISVRMDDGDVVLVAGRHRLEAARRLGWDRIDAVYIDGDETDARLWEISENLHRAELSPVERAEHIDEWRRLTVEKVGQVAPPAGGAQPADKGHRKTADALGVTRETVRRAEAIAALPNEVRQQAKAEGWSQQRLLDMARDADAAEARRRNREADQLIAEQRLHDAVQWLGNRLNAAELHQLGEMLAGVAPQLSKALMREAA